MRERCGKRCFLWLAALLLLLSACARSVTPSATPLLATPLPATAAVTPTRRAPTVTPAALAPTPRPQRLTLCSPEPATLSPFNPSPAGVDLLALMQEDAAERVNFAWEARLLTHIPTVASGDVLTRTTPVAPGMRYVDVTGALRVNESAETLRLPQLVVTFTLRSELFWSDGAPLTMRDALLGYHLAQAPEARGRWRELAERTAQFEALDARRARWVGLPGFLSADAPALLFPFQPAHRYSGLALPAIFADRTPLATGPFVIEAWQPGVGMRLRPNPNYAGAPPLLDEVTVLFPAFDLAQWPRLVEAGECDVVLPAAAMQVNWSAWAALMEEGQARIWADTGYEPIFQRLDFNLAPADARATPLADLRVRQALAQCIDRNRLALVQPGLAFLPADSFVPPDHPGFGGAALTRYAYAPEKGQALLDAAGWRDENGDGFREARDAPGFAAGTPLSLTLLLAPQYTVAAANLAADLETCGVRVFPQPMDARLLYAANPASPLFGRRFDLALFGWSADAPVVCGAWRSERIPSAESAWAGENFSGYVSADYDAACLHALTSVDATARDAALREAGAILSRDLPTLFLTWRPEWFVARPEVQGLRPDASNPAALWNAEALYVGQ